MEESDLNLNPSESGEQQQQQTQVLYVSGNTYYTTAEGEGQEPMVTYMYGDENSAEGQYMMIQGPDGENVLQGAGGEHYMMTSDGGVQYVLVSEDMSSSAQPQFVLDQSAMEGQMIMQNVLNDQMVSGVAMASTELPEMQSSEVPGEVDFLNSVELVAANPAELTSETDFSSELANAGQDQFEPESGLEAGVIGEVTKMEVQESDNLVPDMELAKSEPAAGLEESRPVEKLSSEIKLVSVEPNKAPSTPVSEKPKPRAFEGITKSIHVTSVPIPSSSKESKPIITVKPSPVSHLDGDRIKIETSGGIQKVFILPMSPQGKTTTSKSSSTTLPVRFISQEQMSSFPVQTITLPLKSSAFAGNSPRQIRPAVTVSTGPRTTANILAPNIIKRGVGRPPLKDRLKSPQMQSAGPVKIRPASSQVIVIPIQVSKDSMGGSATINGANTKVTPSGSGAPRVKAMMSASEKALKGVKKGGIMKTKVMPKFTKKQTAKLLDEDESPSSTRRSKRQNNMSMKLAEWGLLPTGGRSSSSSEDELEDELDFDDEEDEELDDDNESNSSISLGIYAKSAQKGARKLVTVDDRRFSTPQVAKVSMGSKAPVRVLTGSAPTKRTVSSGAMLQAPKEMQNKSLMCKPIMMTKATSCNPIRLTKDTQTEKDEGDVIKIPIPIPVPMFVPAPVAMGTRPVPVPVPLPVPVIVPALMPITKNSISNILKQLKSIRESLPPEEESVLKVADAVAESNQEEAETGVDESKAVVKQESSGEEANQMSSYLQQLPLEVVEMAMQIASQMPDDPSDDTALDGTAGESIELDANTLDAVGNLAGAKKQFVSDEGSRPSKRMCIEPEPVKSTLRQIPVNDTRMKLKYSYGLNAWWHWVTQRNAQMEVSAAEVQEGRFKPFKIEILQCSAEELSHCLSLFIREVRKPSGEEYAPDSIFYLCLGIQHYLYENNRIDSLFHDTYYSRFAESLNELLSGFEVRLNAHGQIVCRVTEEHLWESRQLGVHSPHILLNTLVYFNTKHFMLNTTDGHLSLSFSNIMKQWKKNTMTSDGRAARTVYLRYNANGPVVTPTTNAAEAQRRKSLETMPYEQLENPENPLRCPVKLYEFYLSKCPESIKHRNDMFYLLPEPSCVPDSPVWYSTTTLVAEALTKMLNRIRVVREIQESQINQMPAYYS